MFDEPGLGEVAAHVSGLTLVQAGRGAQLGVEGTLLLGWLATRLGWKAGALAGKLRLQRPDGGTVHTSLRGESASGAVTAGTAGALQGVSIEASYGDTAVRGGIERDATGDAATWRLEVTAAGAGTRRFEQRVKLSLSTPVALLERTLHRPARDAALSEAATWADELRDDELACA
ncbi:MAG: OpcA/G6PD domain-containing protein, partial [Polyangiaceae bacterium]